MCGEKPGIQVDRITVSIFYLSLGTKKRQNISSRNPHLKINTLTTVELWKIIEDTFFGSRNINFDRYTLLTRGIKRRESIEHFFGKLKELSENCDLGSLEDALIRDLFIANMQDPKIQRELLKKRLNSHKQYAYPLIWNSDNGINYKFRTINLRCS